MSAAKAEDPAAAPPARLLSPGEIIDGRYRIESYLGGGGMASVYRATHVVLEQSVAIKIISPAIRALPGMAQRFLREARAATHLKSEHVARVSDVGTMADGAPYMVMEYLDGCDLDALLQEGDEVPVEEAVDFVLQACEALAEVHGLGIVHRDLKPANLFLTKAADGLPCVKLIDFGISRTDSPLAAKDVASLTQPDTVMGSPRYMSPEQMESASKADSRSDIYGVGAVLYELLTRRAPHEGETFLDIYTAATLAAAARPSSLRAAVPRELDEVILTCLEADPAKRYVDTAELAAALAPFGPEGSLARADAIARILEAARSRTQIGPEHDEEISTDEASRIRRRVPSSAHALRTKRRTRTAAVLGLLALGGAAFGARTLYLRSHATDAAGLEAVAAPALVVAAPPPASPAPPARALPSAPSALPPARSALPSAPSAPSALPSALGPGPSPLDVATTTKTPLPRDKPPARKPAFVPPAPRPVFVPAAVTVTATAAPAPAATTAAAATADAPVTPPAAPTTDERRLFEDRK